MTNDINMSLLVMVSAMLAKFVGDRFTHSLFHSLLEFKCIPILDPELKIYHNNMRLGRNFGINKIIIMFVMFVLFCRVDLELFPISLVMSTAVKTTNLKSSVFTLANLLLETNHGAFPVVKPGDKAVFMGLISRYARKF